MAKNAKKYQKQIYTILFNFILTFHYFAIFTRGFEMMKYHITIFLIFLSVSASAYAGSEITPPDTGILSLRFKNINFMRDNEYANKITEGYTLIGFLIQPTVVYSPVRNLSLSLGIQLQSYAGAKKLNSPVLIFSTTYKIAKRTTITLGSLDGSDQHLMDDPHFYKERYYTAYTESGLRLVTQDKNLFNDVWVNWENFIHKGDTTREVFHIGESFNAISPIFWGGVNLEIPMQMNFKHLGGQISDYPEYVETFCNLSLGLRINYSIGEGRYGSAALEYKQFRFQYWSPHGTFALDYGNAFWIRVHYNYKSLYFGTCYWKGHNFYAPDGNPIYSCVSERTPDLIIPERSVLTNSLYFTIHPLKYFEVFAGVDSYYDLRTKHLDAALTLHLKFDQMFTLLKFK